MRARLPPPHTHSTTHTPKAPRCIVGEKVRSVCRFAAGSGFQTGCTNACKTWVKKKGAIAELSFTLRQSYSAADPIEPNGEVAYGRAAWAGNERVSRCMHLS